MKATGASIFILKIDLAKRLSRADQYRDCFLGRKLRNTMNCWMVVTICSFVNFVMSGVCRLSAMLFVASIERYDSNRQDASIPFTMCFVFRFLVGPIAGYLGNKVGLRATILTGCLTSAAGISLCFFAEDIFAVTILWGCVFGFGLGLSNCLLPVILSLYFKENLTLANGLAYVGNSFGAIVMPLITDVILETYALSGTFLILGGLVLNSAALSLLLRVPNIQKKKQLEKGEGEKLPVAQHRNSYQSIAELKPEGSNQMLESGNSYQSITELKTPCNEKIINADSFEKTQVPFGTHGYINKAIDLKEEDRYVIRSDIHQIIPVFERQPVSKASSKMPVLLAVHALNDDSAAPFDRRHLTEREEDKLRSSLIPAESNNEQKSMLGSFHIFYDSTFLVIMLTQSVFTFAMTLVWTIIIDFVRDRGVERNKELYFMICIPVSEVFGRLGLGFIVDRGYMTQISYSVACYFILSLSLCFLVWSNSFALLMISLFLFSLIAGGVIISLPGIVTSFMKSNDMTMAMACRQLIYGPLNLTVPSLIGFFRGKLGSYDGLFYIASATCLICCVLIPTIPLLARRRDTKLSR